MSEPYLDAYLCLITCAHSGQIIFLVLVLVLVFKTGFYTMAAYGRVYVVDKTPVKSKSKQVPKPAKH